jgi:hypothetical protein
LERKRGSPVTSLVVAWGGEAIDVVSAGEGGEMVPWRRKDQ